MSRPRLTIVSIADARFLPGLVVAVSSAMAAASGATDYRFLILDGGLTTDSVEKLSHVVRRIAGEKRVEATVELQAVNPARLQTLPERRGSRMTYAKMVLPEILPEEESIVYLDADVLCFAGIEAVRPPAGAEGRWLLAGARDYFGVIEKDCPWIDQVRPAERKLPYINCGVMWMNLARLRDMDFTGRSIEARAAAGNARQGDQSVFNFLCRGKSFILPDSINHCTAIGSARPLCEGNMNLNLHYIGSPKPWLGPPRTSNWLAHQLWHQAAAAISAEEIPLPIFAPPYDRRQIWLKSWLYTVTNPGRAAQYRSDLRSLKDPGEVLAKGRARWCGRSGI